MIIDSLANSHLYASISPRLAQGFAWLAKFDAATPDGRYDIEGDQVFALVQSYTSAPASEKKLESHRKYIDIQFVVAGVEVMLCTPTTGLTALGEFDTKRDIIFYGDAAFASSLHCEPGTFTVYFPHDAHKPGCTVAGPVAVRKVVVKVAV